MSNFDHVESMCAMQRAEGREYDDDASLEEQDWRYEVANGDTQLGFVDWLARQRGAVDIDIVTCQSCGAYHDGFVHKSCPGCGGCLG